MPDSVPPATPRMLTPFPDKPTLIPALVDYRSYHDAHRLALRYPQPGSGQYVDIRWEQLGAAIDNEAWVLEEQLGVRLTADEGPRVVGMLARSDVGYLVSLYALQKLGHIPLLISTRNSRAAIVNLLKVTGATAVLTDATNREEAEASAKEVNSIPVYDVASPPDPSLNNERRRPFPFHLTWAAECDRPAMILHTSGSTGLPKPVSLSSRFFLNQFYYPERFIAKYNGVSVLATLPLFHGSGVALTRNALLWLGWTIVFPDPSRPVNASSLIDICKTPDAPDVVIGAPSVIEEIESLPGGAEVMRGRRFWFFVGAPVPPHFGDHLVKEGIHFLAMLGATEIGQMNVLEPDGRSPEDWNYHEIRPDLDIVLEPRGSNPDDGPFELIILSKDGWRPGTINTRVNGREGYATSDLYSKHASHPRLLKHTGRADDVVVLSNGEKTLSRAIEIPLEEHAHVKNAIVFGTGRQQNGVLVMPAEGHTINPNDETELASFRNAIWSAVERANKQNPSHSQIWKEMILVTSSDKPLPRTDKGSVKRKLAIDMYAKEIDELYLAVESLASDTRDPLPSELNTQNLTPYFQKVVEEGMGRPLKADDDVFSCGMDSLKAIFVRNSLLSAMRNDDRTKDLSSRVPQNFVFLYTTAQAMAEAVESLALTGKLVDSGEESPEQHAQLINDMISKWTQDFPARPEQLLSDGDGGEVVVLTGSTGSLGTFILHTLLQNSHVKKVYAFNRKSSSTSLGRQMRSYQERGLDAATLREAGSTRRLEFLDVEVNAPQFGLEDDIFSAVHASATLIIHNAWVLNFNWSLATFEPVHIAGVRQFVDFALMSPRSTPPRIAFTSSIASAGAKTDEPVPEQPIDDPAVCLPQGYARSKFAAERILALAGERTGLRTLTFRIGQIAGDSTQGIWNASDNVPILVRGCQELGAVPSDWPPVASWCPVDYVARTVVDVCLAAPDARGPDAFHIAHPKPTPWNELVPVIQRTVVAATGKPFDVVPMRQWLDRLNGSGHSAESNPAIRLTQFFENSLAGRGIRCRLALERTKEVSSALREVPYVDEALFTKFIEYWKSVKFLSKLE